MVWSSFLGENRDLNGSKKQNVQYSTLTVLRMERYMRCLEDAYKIPRSRTVSLTIYNDLINQPLFHDSGVAALGNSLPPGYTL